MSLQNYTLKCAAIGEKHRERGLDCVYTAPSESESSMSSHESLCAPWMFQQFSSYMFIAAKGKIWEYITPIKFI